MPYRYVTRKPNKNMIGIKLAYYRKKDWERFINTIDDRESMHDTWNDWHKAYLEAKRDLIKQGFKVKEVEVDINELIIYCKVRGIKNDGDARSQFVTDK